jgi:hypothetical protein
MNENLPNGLTDFSDLGEVDPAVNSLIAQGVHRQADAHLSTKERRKKARQRERMKQRREFRVTYDLPPSIRNRIAKLAEKGKFPASQLAAVLLLEGLRHLDAGDINLDKYKVPSKSPRYEWNLDLWDSPRRRKR